MINMKIFEELLKPGEKLVIALYSALVRRELENNDMLLRFPGDEGVAKIDTEASDGSSCDGACSPICI